MSGWAMIGVMLLVVASYLLGGWMQGSANPPWPSRVPPVDKRVYVPYKDSEGRCRLMVLRSER